jgi:hypothetical protein
MQLVAASKVFLNVIVGSGVRVYLLPGRWLSHCLRLAPGTPASLLAGAAPLLFPSLLMDAL